MFVEEDGIRSWVMNRMHGTNHGFARFSEQPNYAAWIATLKELAREINYPWEPAVGQTPGFCMQLVRNGIDPDRIKAAYILIFDT